MDKGGQPTKMTEKVLGLLKNAFLMGCSDREACLVAEIDPDTLYEYQKRNPEYAEQKAMWKDNPTVKARKTVYESLDDKKTARWYLERKKKKEFSTRSELTGEDGGPIGIAGLMKKVKSEKKNE